MPRFGKTLTLLEKVNLFRLPPNGRRQNGVDPWNFLLGSVGVPGRSTAFGSQLNLGDVIRMGVWWYIGGANIKLM